MRKQAEGLTKEYDRLLDEHAKLQVSWGCTMWQRSVLSNPVGALLAPVLDHSIAVSELKLFPQLLKITLL